MMKKVVITILVFLFAASFVGAAEPKKIQQQVQQNGQFQIVQVEYNSLDLNGDKVKKAVLKIDVLTGQTWILVDETYKPSEGKIIINRGWEELELNLEGSQK
jgi:hypothetical protein